MKRAFIALAVLFGIATAATALQQSQVPGKFSIPFANNAGAPYINFPIPTNSQIGIVNCRASLTDGFPPLTFTPQNAGGCPPFGADFNGILKMISLWSQWSGAGAAVTYDSAFSASIGGYPKNAQIANASVAGCYWISTVDNNTSDPDTGGSGWSASCPGGGIGGTSTGAANAQAVTTTPFALTSGGLPQTGTVISYTVGAGLGNTGALVLNVNGIGNKNVFRISQLGATLSVGGETNPAQRVVMQWDGSEWQCTSCKVVKVGQLYEVTASSTTPDPGTLFADGSCQAQSTYADLYAVEGTSYGTCSAGSFALPDARSNVMVAVANQGSNGTSTNLSLCGNQTTLGGTCGSDALPQSALPNTTLSYSGSASVNVSVSGVVSIGAGQGSHTHVPAAGSEFFVYDTGGPYAPANGGYQGITTSTAVATLPAMSGSFSGSGSGSGYSSGSTSSLNGGVTQTVAVPPVQFIKKAVQL